MRVSEREWVVYTCTWRRLCYIEVESTNVIHPCIVMNRKANVCTQLFSILYSRLLCYAATVDLPTWYSPCRMERQCTPWRIRHQKLHKTAQGSDKMWRWEKGRKGMGGNRWCLRIRIRVRVYGIFTLILIVWTQGRGGVGVQCRRHYSIVLSDVYFTCVGRPAGMAWLLTIIVYTEQSAAITAKKVRIR